MIYCDRLKLNLMTETFQRTSRWSLWVAIACTGHNAARWRAREQDMRFSPTPGPLCAITDLADAEAGQIAPNTEPVYGGYCNLKRQLRDNGQSYFRGLSKTNAIGQSMPVSNDARKRILVSQRPLGLRD